MPRLRLLTLDDLELNAPLCGIVDRLKLSKPGIVLTTGVSGSGKLTTLLALAESLAAKEGPVFLVCDEGSGSFPLFGGLPDNWKVVLVEREENPILSASEETKWRACLSSENIPDEALVVVDRLDQLNFASVLQASVGRWMLCQLDTPLVGIDVAYSLNSIGIDTESFLEHVRLVWSQQLMGRLCDECSVPAQLTAAEIDYLFPTGLPGDDVRSEVGCPVCHDKPPHRRGLRGREAICDVLLIDDLSRSACRKSLDEGTPVALGPLWHVTAQDQARAQVGRGLVGIGTYRDTILRNPLLRAQNQIERQQSTTVKLGSLFDKFVSPEVKRRLMDRATVRSVIAGETVDISCLFCDIRGFTTRSESIGPEELFAELNSYFSEVVDAVQGHDGTVDKFIGDAVMVLFGAPVAQSDHALRAVACAITIIQRVEAFNAARSGHAPIQVGIGINSGRAVAGCLGTETRFAYTALGDTVNIAARLESRAAPGQILISGATAVLLSNSFELNSIGSLELKGKAVKVEAFEVLRMH